MSKWHEKQDVKDPLQKIGETPDGQPVWMDKRELLTSPEENEERIAKTLDSRQKAEIDKAARVILSNASRFIEATALDITPRRVVNAANPKAMLDYAQATGLVAIQDGLKTIVKSGGKIVREMTAKVPPALADAIAKRVNELVKGLPA